MTELKIGIPPQRLFGLSRRRLMQIGVAALAAPACAPQISKPVAGIAPWPTNITTPVVTHPGYGVFPDYFEIGETGPWPKILGEMHKRQLEKFSDLILPGTDTAPAPSEIDIAGFFDDWTSAPYPYMSGTRQLVHEGFAWMDAQSQIDFGKSWLELNTTEATQLLDAMKDGEGAMAQPANMFEHLRKLVIGAYYTTPEGEADLGHVSPVPITGDYPGPTGEALDHIRDLIVSLDLDFDGLPVGVPS